jgi:hypothetical protein
MTGDGDGFAMGPAPPDERFHDQLGAMVQTGDDGLIAGIGMSNITLDHLLRAVEVTEIVCVQNLFSSADHMSCPSYTNASGAAPLSCRSTPWAGIARSTTRYRPTAS